MSPEIEEIVINWRGRYRQGQAPAPQPNAPVTVPLIEMLRKNGVDPDKQTRGYLIKAPGFSDIIIAFGSTNEALVSAIRPVLSYIIENAAALGLDSYLKIGGVPGKPGQAGEAIVFNFVDKENIGANGFYLNGDGSDSNLGFWEGMGNGLVELRSEYRPSSDQDYDYAQIFTNRSDLDDSEIQYKYIATFIHELTHRGDIHKYEQYKLLSEGSAQYFTRPYEVEDDLDGDVLAKTRSTLLALYRNDLIRDGNGQLFSQAGQAGFDGLAYRLREDDRAELQSMKPAINEIRAAIITQYSSRNGFPEFSIEQLQEMADNEDLIQIKAGRSGTEKSDFEVISGFNNSLAAALLSDYFRLMGFPDGIGQDGAPRVGENMPIDPLAWEKMLDIKNRLELIADPTPAQQEELRQAYIDFKLLAASVGTRSPTVSNNLIIIEIGNGAELSVRLGSEQSGSTVPLDLLFEADGRLREFRVDGVDILPNVDAATRDLLEGIGETAFAAARGQAEGTLPADGIRLPFVNFSSEIVDGKRRTTVEIVSNLRGGGSLTTRLNANENNRQVKVEEIDRKSVV